MRHVFEQERGFVKVHVAEYLLSLDYAAGVRETFLKESELHGDEPGYRIGIWRVLTRTANTDEKRNPWIDKIFEVITDPEAPDRTTAVKTLAKLGHPVAGDDVAILEKDLTDGTPCSKNTRATTNCCESLMLQAANGANLGRKWSPAQSDPRGFRRKLLPLVGTAQTIGGGRGTEMDTSTPLFDSTGANHPAALDIRSHRWSARLYHRAQASTHFFSAGFRCSRGGGYITPSSFPTSPPNEWPTRSSISCQPGRKENSQLSSVTIHGSRPLAAPWRPSAGYVGGSRRRSTGSF